MKNKIPADLRADVERFITLMLEKGDARATRDILQLKAALDNDSPVLDTRINLVAANALTPGVAEFDMTDDERYLIGDLLNRMELWREGKPGPAKMFPVRFELRIGEVEQDALGRISRDTGEDRSEIVRRLIREADPGA